MQQLHGRMGKLGACLSSQHRVSSTAITFQRVQGLLRLQTDPVGSRLTVPDAWAVSCFNQ